MLSAYCVDFHRLILYPEPEKSRERVSAAFMKTEETSMETFSEIIRSSSNSTLPGGEMDAMKHVNNIVLRKRILDIQKSSPQG